MPSFTRMKRIFLDGLIWLFLLQYGFMALSLEPGFLDFDNLPDTNFSCHGKVIGGYYADVETNCQMFHVCTKGQAGENMDIRFLCLNGTVFDQETRVCERIDEVDCSKSEQFYSLNLELYQHSGQNSEDIPEVPQETEPPTKSTTTMTTSTTKNPTTKLSSSQYFTTSRPMTATVVANGPQAVSGHHFPVNAPDIRFNPEEINISLNPGAPPDIRTKHFQLSSGYSDVGQTDDHERERLSASTSPKSVYAIDSDKLPQNSDANFGFVEENFRSTEGPRQPQFLIQTNSFRHSQSFPPNVNHNSHQYHHPQFHSTTVKQSGNFPSHTTSRAIYLHSLKPPQVHQHHHYTHHPRTEKTPQRVQIPIPLLPTLPPLTFSSPAPFTLHHHIDSKRYTKEHQSPPRIIISASASVSDASGRRLNYSLGTIGAAQILDSPPSSYDEYKDGDVGLDPFYHDVPKIQERSRRKRSAEETQINPFEVIKNEKEAVEVLKFLFTWYQSHQATATIPPVTSPVSPDLIQAINNELSPKIDEVSLNPASSEIHYTDSKESTSTESMSYNDLFKRGGRFSLVDGRRNAMNSHDKKLREETGKILLERMDVNDKSQDLKAHVDNAEIIVKDFKELPFSVHDYVDDNYEAVIYKDNLNVHKEDRSEIVSKDEEAFSEDQVLQSQKILFDKEHQGFNGNMPDGQLQKPISESPQKTFVQPALLQHNATSQEALDQYKQAYEEETNDTTLPQETTEPGNVEDNDNSSVGHTVVVEDKTEQFVDPSAADLLYKYLNLNQQLTTEATSESPKEGPENQEVNSLIALSDNISTSPLEVAKYTEINVLSEIREEDSVSSRATAAPSPRHHGGRRRVGIRQRQFDSHQSASYNVPNPNREAQNYIARSQNKSAGRRGRNRGRSRFATTSTTPKPTEVTAGISLQLVEATTPISKADNSSSEASSESLIVTNRSGEETTAPYKEIPPATQQEEHFYELLVTLPTENPTTPSTNDIFSYSNTVTTESSTEPLSTTGENTREPVSELNPTGSTASYLIKLLKHFAESDDSAIYAPFTTEAPTSYDPLTENQMVSLPYFVSAKPGRRRSRYRHSSRVSSTELPTLREISKKNISVDEEKIEDSTIESSSSKEVAVKSKADLLDKLSVLERQLDGIELTTPNTRFTTPEAVFEEAAGFGTSYTEVPKASTSSQEISNKFQINANEDYVPFYDDLFVVPELSALNSSHLQGLNVTESNTLPSSEEISTDTTTSSDSLTTSISGVGEDAPTTLPPEVEIQKSISLPVSILDVSYPINDANNINGLLSNEELSTPISFTSEAPIITEMLPVTTDLVPTTTEDIDQHLTHLQDSTMRQVHENSTEIIFLKTKHSDDQSVRLDNPKSVNSSHLYQVVLESSTEHSIPSTSAQYYTRKTRPPRRRPYSNPKTELGRHRFNTELFTITDAPLLRSAAPTKTRELKKILLHTTPISSKTPRTSKVSNRYVFNCFGKETNRFYADPRDCRLFHYCTNGYSKNQLLDLKYVCDQKTFFDEDRVICTKMKPTRCV